MTERESLIACRKCGGSDIGTSFHKQGCSKDGCGCATCRYGDHAKQHEEHLHRYCRACRFDWIDPTLDAVAA